MIPRNGRRITSRYLEAYTVLASTVQLCIYIYMNMYGYTYRH